VDRLTRYGNMISRDFSLLLAWLMQHENNGAWWSSCTWHYA